MITNVIILTIAVMTIVAGAFARNPLRVPPRSSFNVVIPKAQAMQLADHTITKIMVMFAMSCMVKEMK